MDGEVDLCLSMPSLRLLPYRLLHQFSSKDRYIKILPRCLHTLIPLLNRRNTLLNNHQHLNLWLFPLHLLTPYLLITQLFLKVMLLTHNGVRYLLRLRLHNPRCTTRITIIIITSNKLNIPIMLLIHNNHLCRPLDMTILERCMLHLPLSMDIMNNLLRRHSIINRWDNLHLLRQQR